MRRMVEAHMIGLRRGARKATRQSKKRAQPGNGQQQRTPQLTHSSLVFPLMVLIVRWVHHQAETSSVSSAIRALAFDIVASLIGTLGFLGPGSAEFKILAATALRNKAGICVTLGFVALVWASLLHLVGHSLAFSYSQSHVGSCYSYLSHFTFL